MRGRESRSNLKLQSDLTAACLDRTAEALRSGDVELARTWLTSSVWQFSAVTRLARQEQDEISGREAVPDATPISLQQYVDEWRPS